MTKSLFEMLVAALIGSVITIGGISFSSEKIIESATVATNAVNLHQIATVLELYYSDHQAYPAADNGEELVSLLAEHNYILTRPIDSSVFIYAAQADGQEYSLALAQ